MALYSDQTRELEWGHNEGIPATANEAWGARLIIMGNGEVDMLPDRQSFFGKKDKVQKICDCLNSHKQEWLKNAKKLINEGAINSYNVVQHTIYEDDTVKLVGSTHGSYGYLYVSAWLQ